MAFPAALMLLAVLSGAGLATGAPENANALVARQSSASAASGAGSSPSGCPTLTLTSALCSTCTIPACEEVRPLTQSCGCPASIPTTFVSVGCDGDSCAGIGCNPTYAIFTQTQCATTTNGSASNTAAGSGSGVAALSTPIVATSTETGASTWTSTITSTASSGGEIVVITEIGNYNFTTTLSSTVGWRNLTTSSSSAAVTAAGPAATATKTTASTTSSANAAMRLQPFWAMWL